MSSRKRDRVDSDEFEFNSPEVKRLKDYLLGILDDSDELNSAGQDLDSFMKCFEEEISAKSSPAVSVVELTSESGDSQPELGFLFGASDDELGLPPSATENAVESEVLRVLPESNELSSEFWGLGDQISSFDSYEYGYEFAGVSNGTEYVTVDDGLFDYADLGFGSCDFPWRSETLPAQ